MAIANSIVDFLERNARLVVIAAVMLTIVSGALASNLVLEADLERLLPDDAQTVQGLAELESRYGYIGRVTIVLDGDDPARLEEAVDFLEANLASVDDRITRVEGKRPVEFFQDHKYLYVELEDIETASERLKKRIKWEKKQANPLFASLKDEDPPEVDLDDILENYDSVSPESYVHNDDKTRYLVYAFANFPAADLDQSKDFLGTIEPYVYEQIEEQFPGIEVGFTGRYKKRVEQQASLTQDLGQATVVAVVLLSIFLLLFFRGFRASVLVIVPLLMGTSWAFAWAYLVFGTLNILTGFFGAIILGLGIDYGIHVMSRYLEARHEGMGPRDALVTTLQSAGRASIYAGMTTVIAFGSLAASSFQAFYEFGIIALGGMTLIVAANVLVLPAILFLVADTKIEPSRTMNARLADGLSMPQTASRRFRATGMFAAAAAICAVALLGIPNVGIEYDMSKIQATDSPSWDLDEEVAEMVDLSLIPAVVLTESDEHARKVAEVARERAATRPSGESVQRILTLRDLIPPQQDEKLKLLADLEEEIERLPRKVRTEGELAEPYEQISRTVEAGPVTLDKLPISLRAPFELKPGQAGATVLIFPARNLTDSKIMLQLADIAYDLPAEREGEVIHGVNDALLLLDIIELVEEDGVKMLSITIFGLFLVAFIAFRKPGRMMILIGTIAAAILAATGLIGLIEVKFNFINIMVLPIWLGLGVDATFHLMVRQEESPEDLGGFVATALAVSAAFITSMIGFGSMFVTEHAGLYTMGIAAVVGLGTIAVVSMLLQGASFMRPGSDGS